MFRHTLVNHFLEHSAERFSDKIALVHQDKKLTYGEIDIASNRIANALIEIGIERGDRIAVFMDNSIEAVISIFAALKAGAAFMMINHTTKTAKLEFMLNNSRASLLLTQQSKSDIVRTIKCPSLRFVIMSGSQSFCARTEGNEVFSNVPYMSFEDIIKSERDRRLDPKCIDMDLASLIYTSGSTGFPKGVMLSHLNMVSAAHSITTYLENNEHDVIVDMLPLSFDYSLYQILTGFKVGCTVVLEKSFVYPYQVIEAMIRERVTGLPGVPTFFALLLQMKDISALDFSSLRYITNTAAALPASHIKRLRELFPQAKLYSMYGLTECKRVSFLPPEELDKKPTSVGRGMPNEEIFIVNEYGNRVGPGEVGELVVRGSNVMLGYWEMPEETEKCLKPGRYPGEKVLYTGDLFRMDEEGYLFFIARKDDIIKNRGEKVSPKEIEYVLYNLDGVLEAAVIGVPDEILGQAIKAFVSLEKGSKLTEKDILKHCSRHLENFLVPKYIEIMDSLPKTETGKIRKRSLVS